jgi:hypothetical protein
MPTTGTLSFTTTMRMIDWIHSHASNLRTFAEPPRTTGFTNDNLAGIANLSECCHGSDEDETNLARGKSNTSVLTFSVN